MGALQFAVDTADELITEFGKTVVFYREVADSSVDPDMPWRPDGLVPNPPTQYSVTAMTVPYSEKHFDGEVIRRGDVKCILAAKGLIYVPKVGDYATFTSGGEEKKLKVVGITILEPGVDRVLYQLQMRD